MADEYPGVIPMLSYEDCPAALEWLAQAFGFRKVYACRKAMEESGTRRWKPITE